MAKVTTRRVADGFGAPQSHRFVAAVVRAVAALEPEEQVAALRKAPGSVRALLYFCYGPHDVSFCRGPLSYAIIPTSAYVEPSCVGDTDLLAAECSRLTRIFAAGVHPTLTDARRLELWKQIQSRVTREDRELLDGIRMRREVPGISREAVDAAFPGMLDAPPAPDAPVEDISYAPSAMDGEVPILDARGAPAAPPARTERYAELMRAMGWE